MKETLLEKFFCLTKAPSISSVLNDADSLAKLNFGIPVISSCLIVDRYILSIRFMAGKLK